jgi:hypothetical protein
MVYDWHHILERSPNHGSSGSGVPQNRGLVHVSRLYTENFTVCWKGFPVLIAKSSIDQPDQPFSFSQTLEITSEW